MKVIFALFTCLLIVTAIGAGAYWWYSEGDDLIQQIQKSDNKPFLIGRSRK